MFGVVVDMMRDVGFNTRSRGRIILIKRVY